VSDNKGVTVWTEGLTEWSFPEASAWEWSIDDGDRLNVLGDAHGVVASFPTYRVLNVHHTKSLTFGGIQ